MKRQFFTFTLAWLAIALPAVNTQAASDESLFIDKV